MHLPQLLLIYFLTCFTDCQSLCQKYMSVDLSEAIKINDGFFMDGITYDKYSYFEDNGTYRGCICHAKKCIRKCCEKNQNQDLNETLHFNQMCVESHEQFQVSIYNTVSLSKYVDFNDFFIVYGSICPQNSFKGLVDSSDGLFVQENGSLFVEGFFKSYNVENYCIDTFNNEALAVLCIPDELTIVLETLNFPGKLKQCILK